MKKSLGQNFLVDNNTIEKIVENANVTEKDLVIEIGPGEGALTGRLLDRAGKLIAIELDNDLIPKLERRFGSSEKFELIHEDILKVDLRNLTELNRQNFDRMIVLGNLPYYITTPIIMKVLESKTDIDEMLFMMQKEVADRIVSPPGSRVYGAISVAVKYYAEAEKVMSVSREVFRPKPKVESSVVRFEVRSEPPVDVKNEELLFKAIKAGFSQRRKTILNSLSSMGGVEKKEIGEVLDESGIDRQRRAETLSLEEFAKIADSLEVKNETKTNELKK